jgi:hypothetical protein
MCEDAMTQSEKLRQYNRWRRGEEDWSPDERGPCPKELGELIDGVADRLEVLEREHQEFFDRWHEERRKREALQRAVENLVAKKGRHNTEIAYKRLVDVLTHNA